MNQRSTSFLPVAAGKDWLLHATAGPMPASKLRREILENKPQPHLNRSSAIRL